MNILLTRSSYENIRFASKISVMNCNPIDAPVLSFEICKINCPSLYGYDGLIATSAITADFFDEAFDIASLSKSFVQKIPFFGVGPSTAQAFEKKGFTHTVAGRKDAHSLCHDIKKYFHEWDKPVKLLYLAPDFPAFDIPHFFKETGISVAKYTLYRGTPDEEGIKRGLNAIKSNQIAVILFFSKRTAQIFTERLIKAGLSECLKRIRLLCFSDSVLKSSHPELWKSTHVCDEPRTHAMIEKLQDLRALP